MTDIEFIKFLCSQINDIISDGDEPNMDKIIKELDKRNIDVDDVFVY